MRLDSRVNKAGLFIVLAVSLVTAQQKRHFSPREKAFYADDATVEFVNPGLVIAVTGATVAANGTIAVQYTLTDPTGLPLDSAGVYTPGAISTSFVAGYIPNGQEQYTAYTTRVATGTAIASVNQPGADSGGTATVLGNGAYRYVFKTQAPTGFDTTATNTIGIYGSRNLTAYTLPTNYASTTFNFVPNGAKVTHTRDVIETASCNQCHEQLSAHGGSRRGVNLCVMCHTPQNVDPNTGNTVDFKSFIHRIHMGSSLPSVVAGGTFEITTSFGTSNYSTVVDPASAQRCEVCHQQTTGAAQATAFLTNPTRVACGSCHDNVNFATGANHPGGFQTDDTECANCHIPQGETPFDASIMGAHVVATDTAAFYPQNPNTLLSGLNFAITGVTNTKAGSAPVVAFTLLDNSKKPIALSALGSLSLHHGGTDYRLWLHHFRRKHRHARLCYGERVDGREVRCQRQLHLQLHQRNSGEVDGNLRHWGRGAAYGNDTAGNHFIPIGRVWSVQSGELFLGGWFARGDTPHGGGNGQLQHLPRGAGGARDVAQ